MNNDGLDGAVVAELAELFDGLLGRRDHAFKVNHGNLCAESAEGVFLLGAHGEINQRENREKEQKESAAAKQYPEKYAGPRRFRHKRELVYHRKTQAISSKQSAFSSRLLVLCVVRPGFVCIGHVPKRLITNY